jgi:hypothetical protein
MNNIYKYRTIYRIFSNSTIWCALLGYCLFSISSCSDDKAPTSNVVNPIKSRHDSAIFSQSIFSDGSESELWEISLVEKAGLKLSHVYTIMFTGGTLKGLQGHITDYEVGFLRFTDTSGAKYIIRTSQIELIQDNGDPTDPLADMNPIADTPTSAPSSQPTKPQWPDIPVPADISQTIPAAGK